MNRLPYKTKNGNVDVVQDFSGIISDGGGGTAPATTIIRQGKAMDRASRLTVEIPPRVGLLFPALPFPWLRTETHFCLESWKNLRY